MALLVRGKTTCPICGRVIEQGDDAVAFPAFVSNRLDPVFRFSDGAFHRLCVQEDPTGRIALHRSDELMLRLGPGRRSCAVCNEQIRDPDDYLTTGFLTDNTALRASALNYVQLHRSHAHEWRSLHEAIGALRELADSGEWDPAALQPVIDLLSEYDW